MDYVFLNGKKVENPHEDHHHVSPMYVYVGVFSALLVLTVVTYLVSFAGLGSASLPVAMIVAAMKAGLVIAFFMHLAHENRFYLFIMLTSFVLIALFFSVILFDMSSAAELNPEAGLGGPREEAATVKQETAPTRQELAEQPPAASGHH